MNIKKVHPKRKPANKPKNMFISSKEFAETHESSDKYSTMLEKCKVKKNVVSNLNIKICELEKLRQSSLYI